MEKYKVRAFGITKEILGGKEIMMEVEGKTVADLRHQLLVKYPKLSGLRSLLIAVNNTYAEEDVSIGQADEIALIPPVSGG